MIYEKLSIPGLVLFKPKRLDDERGYFEESFRQSIMNEAIDKDIGFVQDNQSFSKKAGTLRGLHFQTPPHAQGKLVRCSQGAITDIALDVRRGSPSFGQYEAAQLSAENGHQLWMPAGFLHGFITRKDNTVVQYKCTDYYTAQCDKVIRWDDPGLAIDWGLGDRSPILSEKDKSAPTFASFISPFTYQAGS